MAEIMTTVIGTSSAPKTQHEFEVSNPLSKPASLIFESATGATAAYVLQPHETFNLGSAQLLSALAIKCEELGTYQIKYKLLAGTVCLQEGQFNIMRDFPQHFAA
jgi:hypothetical protein